MWNVDGRTGRRLRSQRQLLWCGFVDSAGPRAFRPDIQLDGMVCGDANQRHCSEQDQAAGSEAFEVEAEMFDAAGAVGCSLDA